MQTDIPSVYKAIPIMRVSKKILNEQIKLSKDMLIEDLLHVRVLTTTLMGFLILINNLDYPCYTK